MHYAPGTIQGMINPALSKADRRVSACRLMRDSHMVSWSAAQVLKQSGAGGFSQGPIAHVPACSLVTAVGGGGSHRISGSAAQVPACISVLRVSHGLRVCS